MELDGKGGSKGNCQPNDFPHEKTTSNQKPNSDSVSLAYIFDVGLSHPAPDGRLAIPTLLLSNICHHGDGNPTVAPINPAKRSGSIELEPILLGTDRYTVVKPSSHHHKKPRTIPNTGNPLFIEGSLEVKLPTIWRDEKAVSREKSPKRKDQKKEDAGARKGRKAAKHCVFSWFCGSGGLKSRLAKAAGAETSGEMRDEKLHAVAARSRFRSEKVQSTSASDHFWKLIC